jgi:two-component system, cell cycle response regulator DivK
MLSRDANAYSPRIMGGLITLVNETERMHNHYPRIRRRLTQCHPQAYGLRIGAQTMAKLLLVEDNEMNRDMLSRRLVRKGYEVSIAVDGEEGLSKAAESPDLILMDMSLPVLDGWEAMRRLKAAESTRAIPIIALTAHAMSGDEEKAREAGCDDYDTKPIDFARLLGKIEALISKTVSS